MLLILLSWPALATPELPALGIGGNGELQVNQPAQVLVSHATHPHLETFTVSVTYHPHGPLPQTESIGHPDDDGKLNWTPRQGGSIRLKAIAPGSPLIEISRDFKVAGGHDFPNWFHILGLVMGMLAAFVWRKQMQRLQREKTAKI